MENKEKFKKIIEESDLELEDKTMWYQYLEMGQAQEIDALLEAVEEKPEDLAFLTKNIKDTIEAFKSGNEETWKKLAEEDQKYINEE